MKKVTALSSLFFIWIFADAQKKWTEQLKGNISIVNNIGAQTLGYSASSGVKLITVDGFAL